MRKLACKEHSLTTTQSISYSAGLVSILKLVWHIDNANQ